MRPTSSIRSISRVRSAPRSNGTVTVSGPRSAPADLAAQPRQDRLRLLRRHLDAEHPRHAGVAHRAPGGARAAGRGRRACPGPCARRRAPPEAGSRRPSPAAAARAGGPSRSASSTRCAGRAAARCRGSLGPSKVAASSSTVVVASPTSANSAPKMPATTAGRSASQMASIDESRTRSWPSRVTIRSPSPARRAIDAPAGEAVEVEGVQRLPGEQHRVVGDVHDVRDRRACRPPRGGRAARRATGRRARR